MSSPASAPIDAELEATLKEIENGVSFFEDKVEEMRTELEKDQKALDEYWNVIMDESKAEKPLKFFLPAYYANMKSVRNSDTNLVKFENGVLTFEGMKVHIDAMVKMIDLPNPYWGRFRDLASRQERLTFRMKVNRVDNANMKETLNLISAILQTTHAEAYNKKMDRLTTITVVVALAAFGVALLALLSQAGILHL